MRPTGMGQTMERSSSNKLTPAQVEQVLGTVEIWRSGDKPKMDELRKMLAVTELGPPAP